MAILQSPRQAEIIINGSSLCLRAFAAILSGLSGLGKKKRSLERLRSKGGLSES